MWHHHTSRSTYGELLPFLLMMLLLQLSWYASLPDSVDSQSGTLLTWMPYIFIGFLPHVWRIGVWPPGLAGNDLFMCTTFIPCMSLLHDITTHVRIGAKMKPLLKKSPHLAHVGDFCSTIPS